MKEYGRSPVYFCGIPWLFQGVALGKLLSFRENIHVVYIVNQNYREIYFEQDLWISYICW
jgi:hypothetical protein